MFRYNYLSDAAFLKQIDNTSTKTQYIKLIVLNWNDEPINFIEGYATGGNISVNGKSAIRRSGSLTMIADDKIYNITDVNNLLSINKRVSIEIGFKNTFNKYLEHQIIWFPQGIFVLGSANVSKNINSFTISLNLKDKMALLNGECGGILPSPITHHPYYDEVHDPHPAKVRDILYTLLTVYGQIPKHKIIIDDVPLKIKNTVRWMGKTSIYSTGGVEDSFVLHADNKSFQEGESYKTYNFNQNLGYSYTDFTYPAERLESSAGETVTSVLDKIKNALGNYEYFFDIDGIFHFQEIKNYINEGSTLDSWSAALNERYLINAARDSRAVYSFDDLSLISSVNNAPQYNAIKNDITVWGAASDTKAAIRYHLLIDDKPVFKEETYNCVLYKNTEVKNGERVEYGPWRVGPADWVNNETKYKNILDKIKLYDDDGQLREVTTNINQDWRTWLYLDIICNQKQDYLSLEIKEEWPKIIDLEKELLNPEDPSKWLHIIIDGDQQVPDTDAVNWYLDIIDTKEVPSLRWMSISSIGRREKILNDKSINCLFAPNYQNIILIEAGTEETAELRESALGRGENICQVSPAIYQNIGLGSSICSAYDVIRSMLHNITGYNESVNITTVPIFHLEPNTRVSIIDKDTGVYGDYIINSFSIPLAHNGTMTFNCSRAIERV